MAKVHIDNKEIVVGGETYRQIQTHPDYYISDGGAVVSVRVERLREYPEPTGYCRVNVRVGKNQVSRSVEKLLLTTWPIEEISV